MNDGSERVFCKSFFHPLLCHVWGTKQRQSSSRGRVGGKERFGVMSFDIKLSESDIEAVLLHILAETRLKIKNIFYLLLFCPPIERDKDPCHLCAGAF